MKAEQTPESRLRKGTLRDLLYVLFGHKRKVMAFVVLLFGVVALKTLLRPNTYRSEARLLLRLGRENVSLDPTATIGEIANINRSYDGEIKSELEILKSREIVERVIDDLGADGFRRDSKKASSGTATANSPPTGGALRALGNALNAVRAQPARLMVYLGIAAPLSERERAIRRIVENTEIEALENTSVITLAYEEQDPNLARDILDRFIRAFLEKHLAVYHTENSRGFFEQQVSELGEKLSGTEKEFQSAKDATGICSLVEQQSSLVSMIGMLDRSIAETEAELAAATARVAGIQKILAQVPETLVVEEVTGLSDYGADLMRGRLYDLLLAEKEIESKYTRESRQLEMIREQVSEGRSILEKEQSKPARTEVKKGVNDTWQQMQTALATERSNIAALQSKLQKLRAQAVEAQADLRELNDAEIRTSRLQREITLLADSYSRYFAKLEEARIDQALKSERISSISVLQAATMPVEPVGPSKLLLLGLGLVLAIAGGVGFAFFCEYMDHSLKTPEDIQEKLQLPALAFIPRTRLNTVCLMSKASQWRRLETLRGQAPPAQWGIPTDVRQHYSVFRERLLLHANGFMHGHYIIGVTSCSRSEGVSTVAANLASSLSEQTHGAVLLVDANISDPSIHRIFRMRLSPGLVDALAADRDGDGPVIHRAASLSILTAGSANGSSARLVAADTLGSFLHSAKQDYEFIVIDMPAAGEDGSLVRLAGLCDGVVLVVEAQRLRWEVVLKAKQQFQQWNINVLGVLLNKRRFPVPDWVYAAL